MIIYDDFMIIYVLVFKFLEIENIRCYLKYVHLNAKNSKNSKNAIKFKSQKFKIFVVF